MAQHPNPELIALGVRQPWAELIVRGVKTIEVRTVDTSLRGPIYIYASKKMSDHPAARAAVECHELDLDGLPRGVIVGTAEIDSTGALSESDAEAACLRREDVVLPRLIGWRLTSAERLQSPLAVRFLPYGIWFYPFRRRSAAREG